MLSLFGEAPFQLFLAFLVAVALLIALGYALWEVVRGPRPGRIGAPLAFLLLSVAALVMWAVLGLMGGIARVLLGETA